MARFSSAELENGDLAELHALVRASSAADDRLETLGDLLFAAVRRVQRDRVDALHADLNALGQDGDAARRAAEVAALRVRLFDVRSVAEAERIVAACDELAGECPPEELLTRARVLSVAGRAGAWIGTAPALARAASALGEAIGYLRALGKDSERAEAMAVLGYSVQATTGYLDQAVQTLRAACELVAAGSRSQGLWLTFLAEMAQLVGDDQTAQGALTDAIAIGRRSADDRLIVYCAWE